MYYLETNSLRTLLPKLTNPEFTKNSFTSIISLIELVAGINSQKEFDLRNKETISEAVRHSDIVYNLIGRDYETKYII